MMSWKISCSCCSWDFSHVTRQRSFHHFYLCVSKTGNPPSSCFVLIYLFSWSVCKCHRTMNSECNHASTPEETREQECFGVSSSSRNVYLRSSRWLWGWCQAYLHLGQTLVWQGAGPPLQQQERLEMLSFPAVSAHPNQSHHFFQSLEPITAYLISSTMAVDSKGISLSGGSQCQIEPLHALVHP